MLRMSNRVAAAALLLIAGIVPIGIWAITLTTPQLDLTFPSYAFSEENEHRWKYIVITISGVASLVACGAVALTHRTAVLKSALVASIVQALALAVSGAWVLACVAGAPAWWLYRAQHEV
jgi:hypothetical protein